MADEFKDRKKLTFAQAEGVEPLPTQLQTKELSQQLRSLLWFIVHDSLQQSKYVPDYSRPILEKPWKDILFDWFVFRQHRMADEFSALYEPWVERLKNTFAHEEYVNVFDFLQFVLRHTNKPYEFDKKIALAFKRGRAAYALVDGTTIVPIASEVEQKTIEQAFADVAASEFNGARTHLRNSASELTHGRYSDSIRESIHAVESVARVLDPKATTLAPALANLEKSINIHGALKAGFSSLYGFTSDEKGVRHALLDKGAPSVDETDALYMLGSCAAFVSYLINKARDTGLFRATKIGP